MTKIDQLSLKENFFWNFLGSSVYALSQFIIIVLLNKLGSPVMVGLYSIGLAISTPIIMLTNLQLRQIQATDTTGEYLFNDYYALRIVTGFLAIIVIIIILFLSNYSIYKSIIVLLVALNRIIDSYSDVIYGQLQQRERMDYIGKSKAIKGILSIIVMGILLFLTNNLILTLIWINIIWILIFWYYDRKKVKLYIKNIRPFFDLNKMKDLTIFALPLGIVMMLISLDSNLPRIVIERFLGEEALGYFTSISYLIFAGNLFIQSVGQAFSPRMAKLYRKGSIKSFNKIVVFLIFVGMITGIIGLLISIYGGELILTLLYDSSYKNYKQLLILTMISGIFIYSSSFLGFSITAMRLFKIQPFIGLIGVIVNLIFSFLLIPQFGLIGAAYTLIIVSITQFIIKIFIVIINIKYRFHKINLRGNN